MVTTGFKTSFGCDQLQSLWICVLGKKGSQRASARFRALFAFRRRLGATAGQAGLDHEPFARSRYKTGFETSCGTFFKAGQAKEMQEYQRPILQMPMSPIQDFVLSEKPGLNCNRIRTKP